MPKRWNIRPGTTGWPIHRVSSGGWVTAAALLAGLLLRACFVLHHAQFGGDTLVYGDLAHNLRLHHIFGFTQDEGIRPTLIRLPGYPVFVAACFALFGEGNYVAVLWVQVALDLCTCWLLSRLAARLFDHGNRVAHSSRASGAMSGECAAAMPGAPPTTASTSWVGDAATTLSGLPATTAMPGVPSIAPHAMGRTRAANATLWLAALCPFTANYAAVPITECLTLFCITLAFYALQRWMQPSKHQLVILGNAKDLLSLAWPIVIGLALALAVLLRPDRGLLAAAVLPAMLWVATRNGLSLRRLLPVATATLLLLLPLALWGVRNERVFHIFQPLAPRYANDPGESVPLGFQRWYRTWAIDFQSTVDTYWAYDGSTMSTGDLPARAFDSAPQRAATQALFDAYNTNTSASPALDAGFSSLASARIAAHPIRFYLLLPVARVLDMALRPRTELMRLPIDWWSFRRHPGASAFELAYALLNAAYLALALVGLYRWSARSFRPMPPLAVAMLAFVALRVLLLLTLDNSEPRYTLDCFPVILLLAGSATQTTPRSR